MVRIACTAQAVQAYRLSELCNQWRFLCFDKKIDIEVIDFPLLNTNQQRDGLTGTFLADMVLQVLAYVAEMERDNIRQRQAEGIAIAKAKGVKFGRPAISQPLDYKNIVSQWKAGTMTFSEAATKCQMSESTLYRRIRDNNCL